MSTERKTIEVSGIRVEVVRKPIKNLHLSVHPPEGRVRVSAPQRIDEEAVRLAVASRLRWIRRHQQRFADQPRQSKREMVSGESHYFRGRRYRLRVTEHNGPNRVSVNGTSELKMWVRPGTGIDKREQLLNDWYRRYMKELLPALISDWQPIVGVQVADWGVKKMKTRWGSCKHAEPSRLAQSRTRQETASMPGVRPGPRDGSSARTSPQRPLQNTNRQIYAAVAATSRRTKPGTTAARGLGILKKGCVYAFVHAQTSVRHDQLRSSQ